ncbi:L-dopachrome tautomerase-related protein [Acetobacter pomorum]|nr:L-dopachrome tautomerase-related protein [Acetobacter pomorum]
MRGLGRNHPDICQSVPHCVSDSSKNWRHNSMVRRNITLNQKPLSSTTSPKLARRHLLVAGGAGVGLILAKSVRAMPGAIVQTGVHGDQGYESAGSFEIVAEFYGPGPSGIVVTENGRIFVGFPRHAINHKGATLAELVNGHLVPWPRTALSMPSDTPPAERLMSIHGMTQDTRGLIWAIDDGKLAGQPLQPGAAKIVCFDPATNKLVRSIILKSPVLLPDSHMNDLRVDLTHGAEGTVYVTDSSFGHSPALVVVDVATGQQRRVLEKHLSTQAEAGFMAVVEGVPLKYDPTQKPRFVTGGVDGITLSPDSSRVFYAPLTSRRLYSLPTALLSDMSVSENALAAAVKDEGEKGVADGLATDAQGRIYTTNFEHDAIFRRNMDGSMDLMVHDPRVLSPDGIFCTQTHVYCTLGQWNRLAGFHDGKDERQPPYLLIRFPIQGPPVSSAELAGG